MQSLLPKMPAPVLKELDTNFKIPLPFDKPKFPLDSKVKENSKEKQQNKICSKVH